MPKLFSASVDITGPDYLVFLAAASKKFSSFSLVWPQKLSRKENCRQLGHDLRRHLILKRDASCWPGTQLSGGTQTVLKYSLNCETLPVLARPRALFAWCCPDYPEDLAFYDKSGRCGFASVSHEKLAWILDFKFAESLPARFGFIEDKMNERDFKMFDYVA